MKDRGWTVRLDDDNHIVVARSSAHPVTYAITLVTTRDGRWYAVRTFDNSHRADEHHEHRYIGEIKQPPTIEVGNVNAAMHDAMKKIHRNWRRYVWEWMRTVE